MRKILSLIILAVLLQTASAFALTQISGTGTGANVAQGTGSSATTQTATFSAAIPSGSDVVVATSIRVAGGGSPTSCGDDAGNSYAADTTTNTAGSNITEGRVFRSKTTNPITTSNILTCTFGSTNTRKYIAALAFANLAASPVDGTPVVSNNNNSQNFNSGPTATLACPGGGANCEVVVAEVAFDNGSDGVTGEASGWTKFDGGADRHFAFQIVSATTAISYQPTTSAVTRNWSSALVPYKGNGGAVIPVCNVTTLGVGNC